MRKEKKAALKALSKAALTHTCWRILDDAVTSGEDDGFTRDYIRGEREMLADAILDELHALRNLGSHYGIVVEVHGVDLRNWEVGE